VGTRRNFDKAAYRASKLEPQRKGRRVTLPTALACAAGSRMSFIGVGCDDDFLAAADDDVAWDELAATSGFEFAVDRNFAGLNEQLRLTPGACAFAQLEELIEANRVGTICHWLQI